MYNNNNNNNKFSLDNSFIGSLNLVRNKSEISSKPRFTKSNTKSFYLDPYNLDLDNFYDLIKDNLRVNVSYSLVFKVRYNGDRFGMLGSQEGILLKGSDDSIKIEKLFINLKRGIEEFYNKKEYSVNYIDLIQVLFVVILDIPELKIKGINNIMLNKEFVKVKNEKVNFSSNLLPLTVDLNYYGKLLEASDSIKYMNIINQGKSILLYEEKIKEDIDSLYLYNDKYIILNKNIHDSLIVREVYDAETGKNKGTFYDTIISDEVFSRKRGNLVINICRDKVISVKSSKSLPIIKYIAKPYKDSANPMIGSFDLEAYMDDVGSRVYAIGYNVLGELPKTFYIDGYRNSNELVLKCFDDMLVYKYDQHIYYCHNFSGYDSVFILKILKQANIDKGFEYYNLKPIYRDSKMLKLDIKIRKSLTDRKQSRVGARKEPGFIKISLVDSYALLNENLYELSRSFDLKVTKGHFPHSFVRKDTLNYIGNTPSIGYWLNKVDRNNNISKKEYKELYSNNWNLKDECIKYLIMDLKSLLDIMDTFNKYVFRLYDLQMTESFTISRLALNIFLKYYLKESSLPVVKSNMYKDIKQSYFGGVTEVYKPYGKDLIYYDVNSLYPYSALNSIPGRLCIYMEDYGIAGLDLNDLFGFFYCDIETDDNYLGLLPVRHLKGVIMPIGKWSGWYFSEELKFAESNNYKIKVIKGYNFNKQDNVFNQYVYDLFKIKSTNSGHIKTIAKSLLNNLLGRFGMDINKPITQLVNNETLMDIQSTRVYNSPPIQITENDTLISYYPDISKEICESHGKDYFKVYTSSKGKTDMENDKEFRDVSITTAAAITSYARIYMSKIKLDILNKGGNIYYTDTDSIVTDIPLDSNLVGNKLGQFKLVDEIKEAYFITSKTYCLILKNKNKSIVIKVKGAYNGSLSLSDFKELYNGFSVNALKRNTTTNHQEGYVLIGDVKIKLDSNSYVKREKVFLDNKWVDTKPLKYEELFEGNSIMTDYNKKKLF